ncbi:terpenoid synthase [Gautieria morchelliformis]|nr:terpenoid synthase [Gautieria morchelliformis]
MSPSDVAGLSPNHSTFQLPDLTSHCQFTLTCHPNGGIIGKASAEWYQNGCSDFTDKKRKDLIGLKADVLAGYVYHDTDDEHLRVVCDFMNFIFLLDDVSDGLLTKDTKVLAHIVSNALQNPHSYRRILANGMELPEQEPDVSKLARDFWARCIHDAALGFQARFSKSLASYLTAVRTQAYERDKGVIPSLDSYMIARCDNSGLWPLMDCFEYTLRIDLPGYVINHPVINILKQYVNEFVAWSNDIFSFKAEQARGDNYNMVAILMEHHDLDVQGAVDHIADLCRQIIPAFCKSRAELPSWGPEVDKDVSRYIRGLESWMSGSLHWSFITERYFGPEVLEIKQSRVITLIPPEGFMANSTYYVSGR